MLAELACLSAVALPLVGWWGVGALRRRRAIAEALRERCLLCESTDVDGACRSCGYDPKAVPKASRSKLAELQDLQNAIYALREADLAIASAVSAATRDMWGLSRRDVKYLRLEEAQRSGIEALDLLKPLCARHPELVDIPDPELSAELVDRDVDTRSILGALVNHGTKRRVRDALADGRRRLAAYVAVVEALRAIVRDEARAGLRAG